MTFDDDLVRMFPPEAFDERAYLRTYPDVADAVRKGSVESGYAHFLIDGLREGRSPSGLTREPRNQLIRFSGKQSVMANAAVTQNVETIVVSKGGGVLIIGWLDDSGSGVDCIRIVGKNWRLTFDGASLARVRREDVDSALGTNINYPYGYFGFLFAGQLTDAFGEFKLEIRLKDGRTSDMTIGARMVEESELRNMVLSYLAAAGHFGNAQVKGIACIDRGLGNELVNHNASITARLTAAPYVERFGSWTRKHTASIVICLYGKVEYLFLQNALFSMGPGIEDYEFIYVCNSPELSESLLREARVASGIYDIDQTIVILPGNAGFSGANNAAVRVAGTNRIVFVNPDVFPHDPAWAVKHAAVVQGLPRDRTQFFGAPLYYDDGSLMHGGMHFEFDSGPSTDGEKTVQWQLARVEHYGKGAPASSGAYTWSRPVPAVTGAFISCDRAWFEKLGGFSEDYIFGHYEDADLCLKSIEGGILPWLHDIKMWHLEGKGSTRLPVHDGGSFVNRWIFSAKWGAMISEGLLGPRPKNPAFANSGDPFPPTRPVRSEPVHAPSVAKIPDVVIPPAPAIPDPAVIAAASGRAAAARAKAAKSPSGNR